MKYLTFVMVLFYSFLLHAVEIEITGIWNGDKELNKKSTRFDIGQRGMQSKGSYLDNSILKKLDSPTLIGESCSFEVQKEKDNLFLYWIVESSKEECESGIVVSRRPGSVKLVEGKNEVKLSNDFKLIVFIK